MRGRPSSRASSTTGLYEPAGVRRLWTTLAIPGSAWIVLLFVVPFYAIMAVAFGGTDPLFNTPLPEWNPLQWQFDAMGDVLSRVATGDLRPVFVRTFLYVGSALALCFVIGYPVAYYLARYGGRRKALLLALILAPWWINYVMRMLAWVSLLQDDGYVNDVLQALAIAPGPVNWLSGNPWSVIMGLTYGYIPFFIIPLYATLDRIDERLLEASRDLGVGRVRTFLHVTLPLSRQGMLTAAVITALPMFGDYYTNTMISGSPTTTMVGNSIEFYLLGSSQKEVGASLVLVLTTFLLVLMAYYLVQTQRASRELR